MESKQFYYCMSAAIIFLAIVIGVLLCGLILALWKAGFGVFATAIMSLWAFGWGTHRLARYLAKKDTR